MTIVFDHTIVPARDKEEAARFFAHIFGLRYEASTSRFAPVQINGTLTLDFATRETVESQQYAFKVSEEEFDAVFERLRRERIPFGSGPYALENMRINRRKGGRGVYFRDPNGHVLELLTA